MGHVRRLREAARPQHAAAGHAAKTTKAEPAATAAPAHLVALQRSLGNRAVGRLVQAKLNFGRPSDRFEREADRIADEVMRAPAPNASVDAADVSVVTRGAASRRERVGEQSAGQLTTAPASVGRVLASPGRPLDPALQRDLERRFGRDFSRVRVHSGIAAARSAQDVNAHAYTVGQNIVFGAGRFAPETQDGKRLLAHELAHALQQGGSATALQRQPAEGQPNIRPVPEWALTTPAGALPGVPVENYESPRPQYTEVDRSRMLAALNTRVQVNGQRLAQFYHDLRLAWMDLILELASDDDGLSLGAQTIAGIIGNLLTVSLKAGPGLIVGTIADGIVNVTDAVLKEKGSDSRKRRLREMMVARIGDLADLPLIVEFQAAPEKDVYDPDLDRVGRVIIGRDTAGNVIIHHGNFLGLYELHRYCHPDEKALDVYKDRVYGRPYQEVRKQVEALRAHYRQYAKCGADVLLREYIDQFYLEVRRR